MEMATPIKPLAMDTATPTSLSPASSTGSPPDDTPLAIDPQSSPILRQVYVEGIPEQLGSNSSSPETSQQPKQDSHQKQSTPQHQPFCDTDSFDSLLSSLDEADQLSLADDESFYFTPLEEPPNDRMDRLRRELKLRSELLEYLARDHPPAYAEKLVAQEQVVQQMTIRAAQIKETERQRRRAERRGTTVAPKELFQPTLAVSPSKLFPLSYWDFEWYHGLPALASLLLACVAHAALYELVWAVVLVCLQPFLSYRIQTDDANRILDAGHQSAEDIGYGVVLVLGLLLARCSGLLFSFGNGHREIHTKHQFDSTWSQWLQNTRNGRRVKGFLDVLSFYLVFVAVMYFLGRFALCVDQRSTILENMPSNSNIRQTPLHSAKRNLAESCMAEEASSSSSSDSDDEEDPCDTFGDLDAFGNRIVWQGGHEDEAYLYEHLSASVYHQFFGHGYRAALFDLPHQLFFNFACSAMAIYTLRRYFGCSFWEDC